MAKRRDGTARTWKVQSVSVKARDGPERLALAYRRLLGEPSRTPPSSGAAGRSPWKQEGAR